MNQFSLTWGFPIIIYLITTSVHVSWGLRINRLDVPTAILNGTPVLLGCDFDLEGETLYSVKWYKNYVEFYRFLPSNVPEPSETMDMKGAIVDVTRSNSTHVYLKHTDLESEGIFTCEISTESPSYSTVRAEEIMQVYVLPTEKLRIDGNTINTRLDVGDHINLTCVSGPSRPAAKISWFINGDMALSNQVIQYPIQTLMNGMQTRKLGLYLQASSDLFKKGILRLRCSATLLLTYQFEANRILSASSPSSTGFDAPDSGTFYLSDGYYVQRAREAPIILGGRSRYRIGDWISLNCSTTSGDGHLRWYINGNDAGPLHTKDFVTVSDSNSPTSQWILGLRIHLQKYHFQLQELKLKCVSTYHDIIKEYQTHISVISKNYEAIEAQSASTSSAPHASSSIIPVLAMTITLYDGGSAAKREYTNNEPILRDCFLLTNRIIKVGEIVSFRIKKTQSRYDETTITIGVFNYDREEVMNSHEIPRMKEMALKALSTNLHAKITYPMSIGNMIEIHRQSLRFTTIRMISKDVTVEEKQFKFQMQRPMFFFAMTGSVSEMEIVDCFFDENPDVSNPEMIFLNESTNLKDGKIVTRTELVLNEAGRKFPQRSISTQFMSQRTGPPNQLNKASSMVKMKWNSGILSTPPTKMNLTTNSPQKDTNNNHNSKGDFTSSSSSNTRCSSINSESSASSGSQIVINKMPSLPAFPSRVIHNSSILSCDNTFLNGLYPNVGISPNGRTATRLSHSTTVKRSSVAYFSAPLKEGDSLRFQVAAVDSDFDKPAGRIGLSYCSIGKIVTDKTHHSQPCFAGRCLQAPQLLQLPLKTLRVNDVLTIKRVNHKQVTVSKNCDLLSVQFPVIGNLPKELVVFFLLDRNIVSLTIC